MSVDVVRMPQRCAAADDFDPLCGGKFVGREDVADFVVENFGGRTG